MVEYGVTDAGYVLKRLEDLRAENKDAAIEKFGPEADVSDDSNLGNILDMGRCANGLCRV